MSIAGIPPGKSDALGGIGPRHIVTSTLGFSARCRPMRPIFPAEFHLMKQMVCLGRVFIIWGPQTPENEKKCFFLEITHITKGRHMTYTLVRPSFLIREQVKSRLEFIIT